MKKTEKILLIITIIVVIAGAGYIFFITKASETKLVEKLNIVKEKEVLGQTILGSYVWNNPTTAFFKKNVRVNSVPANVLLEETLEIKVYQEDNLILKIDEEKYNKDAYKINKNVNISYMQKDGSIVKEEKLNFKNNDIYFKIPTLEGIYYASVEINYEDKGTVYNFIKLDIRKKVL